MTIGAGIQKFITDVAPQSSRSPEANKSWLTRRCGNKCDRGYLSFFSEPFLESRALLRLSASGLIELVPTTNGIAEPHDSGFVYFGGYVDWISW